MANVLWSRFKRLNKLKARFARIEDALLLSLKTSIVKP